MAGGGLKSTIKGPKEAYHSLAEKGALTAKDSSITVFVQSFMAGCYIGFGALLATVISERLDGWTDDNAGLKTFVFAALFPVNLLLILLSGGILFTGTSAACPAAFYEGKARLVDCARCLGLSWAGNVLGSLAFAIFTEWCELNKEDTAFGAAGITEKKTSKGFITTFMKGIGCNWMVCMAVFLCGMSQDMVGKYVGIWFPISTFVMIGFEHIPANFYLCILGLLANKNDVTFADVLLKNWIPVTLGNFVAGAFIVAGGYSFLFGRLGNRATLDNSAVINHAARRSMGFNDPEAQIDMEAINKAARKSIGVHDPEVSQTALNAAARKSMGYTDPDAIDNAAISASARKSMGFNDPDAQVDQAALAASARKSMGYNEAAANESTPAEGTLLSLEVGEIRSI